MYAATPVRFPSHLRVHKPGRSCCDSTCTEADRQTLILEHLPMVPKIVSKTLKNIRGPHDVDEFISAGNLGLVQAARTFDPTFGSKFGVYAYRRIRGEVLDELRRKCFLPISAYRQVRRLRRLQFGLRNELGRPPSDEELAQAANVSRDHLGHVLSVLGEAHYLTGDDMDILPLVPSGVPQPEDRAEIDENLERLAAAIKTLPHQYRVVLALYFRRGKKMKTIGRRLGLTESRISQICARAIALLTSQMVPKTSLAA